MIKFKVFLRVLIFTCLLVLGGVIYPFSALAIFIDDFVVSDTGIGFPDYPQIGCDSAGNFVCLWVDDDFDGTGYNRIFIKGYDPQGQVRFGPKLMPTDSLRVYSWPAMYVSPGGDFVVACNDWWIVGTDSAKVNINIQRYDVNGNEVGDRISFFFIDSSGTSVDLSFVRDVGMDSLGRIIITGEQAGSGEGYGQLFGADNQPLDPSFRLSAGDTVTLYTERNSQVAVFRDGKFVIVFDGALQPWGRIYDSQGSPVTGVFSLSCDTIPVTPGCEVNPSGCNGGGFPVVSVVNEQNFMVAYNACGDFDGNYVYERVFDSLGNPLTSNRMLNNVKTTNTYWVRPQISCDGKGNCVTIWADDRNSYFNGPADLFVQRLDSLGDPIGTNHRVNTVVGAADISYFDVATNGRQVYSLWTDRRKEAERQFDMYAQVMDFDKVGVFVPGDGNLDGKVNVIDIIHLVNYVFKGAKIPKSELWISDINTDCKVNITDVIYLVNFVFKNGAAPKIGCA